MFLQPLVWQSPHLLSQGCNLVANWLGGKKLKFGIRIGHNKYGRQGVVFGKVRWYNGHIQAGWIWPMECQRAVMKHIIYTHTCTLTRTSPAGAITSSGRWDYLAILSCRAILGCSWKFTLCPCVFFPPPLSLFLSPSLPFSLVTFLDRPIFQAPDIGDYK